MSDALLFLSSPVALPWLGLAGAERGLLGRFCPFIEFGQLRAQSLATCLDGCKIVDFGWACHDATSRFGETM